MRHDLKIWPGPFRAVFMGDKRHEVRRFDRAFQVGDTLRLREWDPTAEDYTGQHWDVEVTYLTEGGAWGLPKNLCVMSLRPCQ